MAEPPVSQLDDLKRKLAERERQPGFAENLDDLKRRIAQLEGKDAN